MKLSDYVARFLAAQGIRHVFAISGGASLHLIHSLTDTPGVEVVCPQHEQGGAIAADAYARVTGGLGAALATSGPGATNMITGICCAYYDSVPVIYITGQVATFRMKGDSGVRQVGFQETDISDMCRTITKYAVTVTEPTHIRYELEKAVYLASSGRPGPVLVDIPDDLQRANIDPEALEGFHPEPDVHPQPDIGDQVRDCIELIQAARRPVLVLGFGVRLAGAVGEALALAERYSLPILPTWGALDMVPASHPLLVGSFGTHGTRYGNFAIQNSDLIVSIGSRLDTHVVGSPFAHFGRAAKKVMIDIDHAEINKFDRFGMTIDLGIVADAKAFLEAALRTNVGPLDSRPEWRDTLSRWKDKWPIPESPPSTGGKVDPYAFVAALSEQTEEGDVIVVDTGCSVAWMSQGFRFKAGQRYMHAFNNTPMGYALPAAMAASLALNGRRVICVAGDGGLHMNIQELSTVVHHRLPVKIFLLNNHGYSMIQQTQDQWLGSRYLASSPQGGLGMPNFDAVARAYGFATESLSANADLTAGVSRALAHDGPYFCNLEILPEERVRPQVKFGRPIEDPEPLLPRHEFFQEMVVAPVHGSNAKAQESEPMCPLAVT